MYRQVVPGFMKTSLLLLMVILILGGCQKAEVEVPKQKVVVRVNGDPITEEEVLRRIQSVRGEVTKEDVDPGTWQRLTEAAVDSEILDLLLYQASVKEGFSVSTQRVNADLARTREMLGDEPYEEMLQKRGVEEEGLHQYLERRILITRYREHLLSHINPGDDQLEAYFEGHPERFALPDNWRLHILVYTQPGDAAAAYERYDKGTSFDTIAADHKESGGKGTRTRPMPRDAIPGGMKEVVVRARTGDVVHYEGADSGYLIKVLEKIEGGARNFEEAREDVREYLTELRKQKFLDDWYEQGLRQASIEYLEDHGVK